MAWSLCGAALALVAAGVLPASARGASPNAGPAAALFRYGAPVHDDRTATVDSPTSFNATLPNGRRVTPAGRSVQVGENPLGAAITPDGKYLVVSDDDERNVGIRSTSPLSPTNPALGTITGARQNGAGAVPGGYTLAVVRTSDMRVVTSTLTPPNIYPHPGVSAPGVSQSDKTAGLFLGVAVKPNPAAPGAFKVYAAGGPSDVVYVYSLDGATGALSQTTPITEISVPVPTDLTRPNDGMAAPGGLTLSPDGSKLYIVNNDANTVVTVDTATDRVVGTPVPVGFFPYTSVLAPDGSKLYVSNWGVTERRFNGAYLSNATIVSGTETGTGSLDVGGVPGNLFANPATNPMSTSSVSVVDLNGGITGGVGSSVSLARPIDGVNIVGGTHPSAMAVVARRREAVLYVADANEDALALIDTRTDRLLRKVYLPSPVAGLRRDGGTPPGLTPNALAVSPDARRLYVAEAGLNAVAVYDVSSPRQPRFLGRIPTGWYPTGVTVSPDGRTLYVTNEKGLGSDYHFQGAVPGSPDVNLLFGTIQKVDLASLDLHRTTARVEANTYRTIDHPRANVIDAVRPNIQHVFFILRENKTYDTYYGADATLNGRGANGDPSKARFDPYVPNSKALAEQFAIGDNAYADSEESNAGHFFALAGTSTDYQQKTLLSRFNRPLLNIKNEDPADYPLAGFIFNNAERSGVGYKDYGDLLRISGYDDGQNPNPCADDPGEVSCPATYSYTDTTSPITGFGGRYASTLPGLAALNGHVDPNYPGWNLRISDQRRVGEYIRDTSGRTGQLDPAKTPQFTYIWLPDDHTGAGLDPRFEVSDNDAALGQLVEYISHSAIWPHTAIFVTEDDGQGTADHVNPHRVSTIVISPYAKRGAIVHTLNSTVSIPKTIEELLGMPAMNLGDLLANDLSDFFTATPDYTPYRALRQASLVPATAAALRIAALTAKLNQVSYDRDTARLGQLDALFLDAQQLDERRARVFPLRYQMDQDWYYRVGREIAAGHLVVPDSDG